MFSAVIFPLAIKSVNSDKLEAIIPFRKVIFSNAVSSISFLRYFLLISSNRSSFAFDISSKVRNEESAFSSVSSVCVSADFMNSYVFYDT